jgi:tetratricopeptide (TPR) repeat protein
MSTAPGSRPDPRQLVYLFVNRADRLREEGRYDDSERLFKQALALAEQSFAADSPELIAVLNNHAVLYKYSGHFDEAEWLYRRALSLIILHFGDDHPEVATIYHNLGGLDHARGRFAEGEAAARRAVEIRRRALEANHPQVTESHLAADLAALAGILDGQRKYHLSEPIYYHVLAIFERQLEEGVKGAAYEVAINLNNLAALYAKTNRRREAEPLYRRALALKESLFGAAHPDIAVTLNNLGVLLKSLGRRAEAAEIYARGLAIFEDALPAGHPKLKAIKTNLEKLPND